MFIAAGSASSEELTPTIIKEVSLAVQRQYQSTCVILLYSDEQGMRKHVHELNLEKTFAGLLISVTRHSLWTLNGTLVGKHCISPLYIILSCDEHTQQAVEQLSWRTSLTFGRWLMFLDARPMDQFFRDVYIPFDCEFLVAQSDTSSDGLRVLLTEVYHMHPTHQMQMLHAGVWSPRVGLTWTSIPFLLRRGDLHGVTLKGAVVTSGRGESTGKERRASGIAGYTGNIWKVVEEASNFKTEYFYTSDNTVGFIGNNGTATGIFRMVLDNDVEIGLETSTINTDYLPYVNFLFPTWCYRLSMFIKKPSIYNSLWDAVAAPFSRGMWFAVLSAMIMLALVLTGTWYIGRVCGEKGKQRLCLKDTWFYIFGVFCSQGADVTPISLSCRVVYLVSLLTAVILTQSYSAIIISYLSVEQFQLPFTNFQTFVDDNSYEFGVAAYNEVIFKEASDEMLLKMHKKLIRNGKDRIPDTEEEGLRRLCTSDKYAFMTADFFVRIFRHVITCEIVEIPQISVVTYGSIVVNKSIPYIKTFNKKLKDMTAFGIIKRVAEDDAPSMMREMEEMEVTRVSLEIVTPIFMILVAGIAVAVLCLCAERLVHSHHKRVRLRNYVLQI
ncbi:glutamate receptor U1-like [Periplaneta americana]|uniref:glutamate receptor U1-like n=1 Tax=Periplaneta americana TaxID=6978 RepID=UPI0037E8A078